MNPRDQRRAEKRAQFDREMAERIRKESVEVAAQALGSRFGPSSELMRTTRDRNEDL